MEGLTWQACPMWQGDKVAPDEVQSPALWGLVPGLQAAGF